MTDRSPSRVIVTIALAVSAVFTGGWDLLSSADEDIERGNQLYRDGDYDGALEAYRAAADSSDDPTIQFDIGAALYKLAEGATDSETRKAALEQAEGAFRKATEARDDKLRGSAHFNLGNTLYQRESYADAVESYKKSLRANPAADDVRYNLELAQRKLHKDDQEQQGGQGKPPPQGGGDKNQDNKQQDPNGQGQDSDQNQGDPGKDAFNVSHAAQDFSQGGMGIAGQQFPNGLMPQTYLLLVTQRVADPASQQTAAHRGD